MSQRATTSSKSSQSSSSGGASRRVVVVGGNGYVGAHILRELANRQKFDVNIQIASLSRSGRPTVHAKPEEWANKVEWNKGDALAADSEDVTRALAGTTAVISAVGGFGGVAAMERINGDANAAIMQAAKKANVQRFVYISAHHYALPAFLKKGYFAGKFKAEAALVDTFADQAVQIRPSFVFGTRQVMGFGLPLGFIGWPLQKLTDTRPIRALTQIPLLGPVLALPLTPPVSVEAVARAAVDAALASTVDNNIIQVDDLLKYEK